MRAMVLTAPGPVGPDRLELRELPVPVPARGEVLVRVAANAVCRTDLHIVEGDLPPQKDAIVPGHQIVGIVEATGDGVEEPGAGDRVGVPWLGGTCGRCRFCRAGRENLCDDPTFTGYHRDGGYAEYAVARADFTLPIPAEYGDVETAPLLCAGLIGYRALRLTGIEALSGSPRLGMFGFGASAHIVIQVARHLGYEVYVQTRGTAGRQLALELGAVWAGASDELPPVELDSAIVFAPVGALVPVALRATRKGGSVVLAGIHMTPVPELDYALLWGERSLRSVANLTRQDGREFIELAPKVPVEVETHRFALENANEALALHERGDFRGAAVLVP
jgi:propanol-preferring alcohol dehydrogenase